MIKFPFIGGSYAGRSRLLDSQRSINLYPVMDNTGAKDVIALMATPGLVGFCNLGSDCQIRGMIPMGDYLYVIGGADLYRVNVQGEATGRPGSLTTYDGIVYMAHDGTNLMVVNPDLMVSPFRSTW